MPQDKSTPDIKDDDRTITLLRSTPIGAISWEPVPDTITQIEGPGAPQTFSLESERVVIGRSSRADIQIVSSMISRQHLFLWRSSDQEYVCEDMNSQNGVLLKPVAKDPAKRVKCCQGDGELLCLQKRHVD